MKINFDDNWKFKLADLPPHAPTDGWGGAKARAYDFGAVKFTLDDTDWRGITLPHDFVSEGKYTLKSPDGEEMQSIPAMGSIDSRHFAAGCLEGGVAWYRKHFDIPQDMEDKRVYIHFDGIYRDSAVYLNEYYICTHVSGYTGFCCDITDFVNYGGENVLAVRVDSRGREGWWYEGGGIYRHTWLEYRSCTAFETDGIFVNAVPDLSNGSAKITVKACAENYTLAPVTAEVEASITDADGNTVQTAQIPLSIDAWDKGECTLTLALDNAHLWNLDDPYMYTARLKLIVAGVTADECDVSFGIREFKFNAEHGFYINGKNVKIKGVCLHHDHAGVGTAIPESVHEYRIELVKSMGANAIRSSHYPAAPELLDICDRAGILVFEETRRMSAAPEDLACLSAMVRRDRNHPSIFLWGIGNEEIFAQARPETARSTVTMKAVVDKLDGTRPVTSAVVCWNGHERFDTAESYIPVTKHLDVMGFNYCRNAWDDYHRRVPEQPIIITEAATANGTRGIYTTDESKGFYTPFDPDNGTKCRIAHKAVRDKDIIQGEWKYFAEREYLAGIFLWTGFDYRGEPTPLTYPAVYSQFGIFDYCGFKKDNFYYYKSWFTDEPTIHIFPHWNHTAGESVSVYCYSNCETVELFVNGKSLGKKRMERNWYLEWENVEYEPGEVSAVGYTDGKAVITDTVKTTGEAAQIELTAYNQSIKVGDTAIITARIADSDGRAVPTSNNEITFEITGGEFVGTGNGNPGDHASERVPVRRSFGGLCMLLVRAAHAGVITVRASADGLQCGNISIIAE